MPYDVDVDLYEGPLPLLVELATLQLIDVFLISLVDLTDHFLQRVKVSTTGVNELAEPLPLLGSLILMKARRLLPQPTRPDEAEEVPIGLEELERRLKEYEQFKTVAQLLAELHALQHEHFTRSQTDVTMEDGESSANEAPLEVGLADLMGAFSKVLEKASAPVYQVIAEPWTVEMKVQELRVLLMVERQVRFLDLFTAEQSRLELVVTFLALLELIRQRVARAIQERPFADIVIALRAAASIREAH